MVSPFKAGSAFSAGLRAPVGIAHWRTENVFNGTNQPTHLAAFQLGTVNLFWCEDPETVCVIDWPVLITLILSPLRMVPF